MRLHLRPLDDGQVIPFPNTEAESRTALEAQITNIVNTLASRHGAIDGRLMLADAAVAVVARLARADGHHIATLFAFDVAINNELNMGAA